MFLEVCQNWKRKGQEVVSYDTILTIRLREHAVCALQILDDHDLEANPLGCINLRNVANQGIIIPWFIHPFWDKFEKKGRWIHFQERPWWRNLLRKWIAGALEYFIFSQFSEKKLEVLNSWNISALRWAWLRKRKIREYEPIGRYLLKLRSCLSSPSFRIVKFPPWITDPDILALWEQK